ncbi:MAG: asparagine synthase (glutamine-hydrolyzing) [Sporomusaceae bacterium]|nr:asparagine synthase (glutamine-hydrolyzing) [Sporomusaceae bacterium]
MCGVCGIVGDSTGMQGDEITVRRMMNRLAHRGPDGEGFISGNEFMFGHKRLAIIDLEYGAQPMQTEDGLITIVFNGEIYNYIELRQELSRKGFKFKTFSDTEVLLRLYEAEQEDCLKRLTGMFAFAIFDNRRKCFFAARDHFGIKPFYYSFLPDGRLVFASEIKALFESKGINAKPDMEAVSEYLTFQFCFGDKTLFAGISKLEPGQYMLWDLASSSNPIKRFYWQQKYEIDTYHTEEYFFDTLLLLLQDSMRQQLRSDVPVGVYLSGGLDSSTVASLASIHYGKGLKCFNGKFAEGPAYDESYYAGIVADSVQGTLYQSIITAENLVEYLPRLIYHLDEPVAGPGLLPQYIVSSQAAGEVKVVLGGQGGDEVFGGYARYLVAYLEQCIKGSIYQTQEEGRHVVTLSNIIASLPLLKQYVPMIKNFWDEGLFDSMDARYFRLINRSHDLKALLAEEAIADYREEQMFEKFSNHFNSSKTTSYLNKMLHFDQTTLLPALLQIEDRVSMAVSLESRVPLLDHRIVDLANTMPPTLKFKNGQPKFVLSHVMKNLLPPEIVNRKDKMGFPVPIKEWLQKGPVREFAYDTLLSDAARQRGLYNTDNVRKALTAESSYGRQIWGLLCLELWFGIYIDRQGAA